MQTGWGWVTADIGYLLCASIIPGTCLVLRKCPWRFQGSLSALEMKGGVA